MATAPEDVPLYERVVTWDMEGIPDGYAGLSGYSDAEPGTVPVANLPLVRLAALLGGSGGGGGVGGADYLKQLAKTPEALIQGTITGDPVTSAEVMWPGGIPGTLTILERDAFGSVNSYKITYGVPSVRTYTQPVLTRNENGAVTYVPAIVVEGEVEESFPTFAARISGGTATSTPNNVLSGGNASSVPAYIIRGGSSGSTGLQFASRLIGGDSSTEATTILTGGNSASESQYQILGGGA